MSSWNPVLNKVLEIKSAYKHKFNTISYDYDERSCVEKWIEALKIGDYFELFKPLQVNQHNNLLLIRYGDYTNIYSGAKDFDRANEEFWELHDGFYKECRSVVIDIVNEELVLTPFKKFRNINECEKTSLDNVRRRIDDASVVEFSEKLDGSMQSARWYNGELVMSGSMALDSEKSYRLKNGYNYINSNKNYLNMIKNNPQYTFIFESILPDDPHIVFYPKNREGLHLIGVRNVGSGKELGYWFIKDVATEWKLFCPKLYDINIDEALEHTKLVKSNEGEGYVINIDGFKVKLKHDDYVELHRHLSRITSTNFIIRAIANGNYDDIIAKTPESQKERVSNVANIVFTYINYMTSLINYYYNLAPKETKKDFMIYVNNNVHKNLRHYVRNKYNNKNNNLLLTCEHSGTPGYKKLEELILL